MSKLKIQIVEDNPLHLSKLEFFAEREGYLVIATSDNAEEAGRLAAMNRPDIILIDIQLEGEKTGIDLADYVKKELDIPVIYLTSLVNSEVLEAAARTEPDAYLVKPPDENSLKAAIEMVRLRRSSMQAELEAEPLGAAAAGREMMSDSIFIRVGKVLKRIYYKDIVTIKATQINYSGIYLANGQMFDIRKSLTALEPLLPPNFCRIHRQQIINCTFVDAIKSDFSAVTVGDEKLSIGTTYRKQVAQKVKYIV